MRVRPSLLAAVALVATPLVALANVTIKHDGPNYQLLVDGKPFFIEGVGGGGSKSLLKAVGGNAFRTWGDDDTQKQLDEAQKLGLKVVVGIWLAHETKDVKYSDAAFVQKQFDRAKAQVETYKNHPALLMWGVGNEMEGYKSGDDPKIWKAVDDIAAMCKQVDPNHPTMAVIAEIGGNKLAALRDLAPHVDVVGINSYAGAGSLGARFAAGKVNKPYVVTEFGPPGTWEVAKTAWDVAIEPTSTQKAEAYKTSYEKGVLAEKDKQCLGSFAFTWGNKQETTGTWFGMLLPDGARVGAVDVMQTLWTGKPPADRCPTIEPIHVEATTLKPGETFDATVMAKDPEGKPLTAQWTLMEETKVHGVGGSFEATPAVVSGAIVSGDTTGAKVKMPDHPGSYRLFVEVKDAANGAATANVPLFIAGEAKAAAERLAEPAKLPFVIVGDAPSGTTYVPSGWMGKTESLAIDPKSTDDPHEGATCMKCEFKSGDNYGGIVWQSPANDWGDAKGGLDLTGAKRLTFWARGATGGEKVDFKFGILDDRSKPFYDTGGGETSVTLEPTWTQYSIDLAGKDLRRIKTGFVWSLAAAGKPVTFYLDDVRYE